MGILNTGLKIGHFHTCIYDKTGRKTITFILALLLQQITTYTSHTITGT